MYKVRHQLPKYQLNNKCMHFILYYLIIMEPYMDVVMMNYINLYVGLMFTLMLKYLGMMKNLKVLVFFMVININLWGKYFHGICYCCGDFIKLRQVGKICIALIFIIIFYVYLIFVINFNDFLTLISIYFHDLHKFVLFI